MQIEEALRIAADPRSASEEDLKSATIALACGFFWQEAHECHRARLVFGFSGNKHTDATLNEAVLK